MTTIRQIFADPRMLEGSAFFRREIADRMHERLALLKGQPGRILDAGCGEGEDLTRFLQDFPLAGLTGLDATFNLLRSSAQQSRFNLLCGDMAFLPLRSKSIDLLWSNLALYWHPEPALLLAEWKRVLSREGILMFSTVGPSTLGKLAKRFEGIDGFVDVLSFPDMHMLGDWLVAAGFASPVLDREIITLEYEGLDTLVSDLCALGWLCHDSAHEVRLNKQAAECIHSSPTGKQVETGEIRLDVEVIYGHAFAKAQFPEGEMIRPVHFL